MWLQLQDNPKEEESQIVDKIMSMREVTRKNTETGESETVEEFYVKYKNL